MKRLLLCTSVLLLVTAVPVLAQEKNLQKGVAAYKNKNYTDAIPLLQSELVKSPDSKEANYYLGMALWNTGNSDSALVFLKKAYQRDSKNAEYTWSLGNLYLEKNMFVEAEQVFQAGLAVGKKSYKSRFYYGLGQAEMASDSLNSAIVYLMHAREADAKDVKTYIALGEAYSRQKVNSVAIENYRKAVELDSTLIDIRYELARLLYKSQQFNDALAEYKIIVQMDPSYRDAYYQIANLYYRAEPRGSRFPEAIENAEAAAEVDSTSVELTRLLTQLYYGTRDYAKAAEAYGRLAALDTLSAREYLDWGRSYQALKQNASAITALEKAVAMDSTLDLHFDIGTLLYNEQRYPEAIVHYEKKAQADSQSVGAYLNMGFSYIRLQKYAEAVKAFRKGVELRPDDLQGHLWLAQSYAMLDDLEQAKNEYMVVAKLDSTDAASRRYIGFYHLMKKQYPSAISYLQRSVALESGDAQAHLWLAQAFLLNHQGDQALVEYRRVLQLDPSNKEAQKRVKILE